MVDAVPGTNEVHERCRSSISRMELLKLLSAVLVPLMIGIFTIVTTIQQIQSEKEARATSLFIAQLEREKDIYMADELRRENLFSAYIHDLIDAVKENNWTVHARHALRAKTIATFRELDGIRKGRLVQFMYEYYVVRFKDNALSFITDDLDLSDLMFESPIQRSSLSQWLRMSDLALPKALLSKASFANIFLMNAYLPKTILSRANFTNCDMFGANFTDALLDDTDFTGTYVSYVDFTRADFSRSNINITRLEDTGNNLTNIIYPNGTHIATIRPVNLILDGNAERTHSNHNCSLMNKWTGENIIAINYGSADSYLLISDAYDGINNSCLFVGIDRELSFMSMKDDTVVTDYGRLIQLGRAEFELSAWLGGVGNSPASFTVTLRFFSAIGRMTLFDLEQVNNEDRRNITKLLHRSLKGLIPVDTAGFNIELGYFPTDEQSFTAVFADDIEFRIRSKA